MKGYTEIVGLNKIFGLSFEEKICGIEKMHGADLSQGPPTCTII